MLAKKLKRGKTTTKGDLSQYVFLYLIFEYMNVLHIPKCNLEIFFFYWVPR